MPLRRRPPPDSTAPVSQARIDIDKIAPDPISGDLFTAKSAFAKFQTDAAAAFEKEQEAASSTGSTTPSTSEIGADALSDGTTFSVTV